MPFKSSAPQRLWGIIRHNRSTGVDSPFLCFDRLIENALEVMKISKIIVKIESKIGDGIILFRVLSPSELDHLSFAALNDRAKFHQILFKIAPWAMTDTTHTDRQMPAILLPVPCYAIAMGQIIIDECIGVRLTGVSCKVCIAWLCIVELWQDIFEWMLTRGRCNFRILQHWRRQYALHIKSCL